MHIKCKNLNKGFTLVESVVTIAIIAIISVMLINVSTAAENARLKNAKKDFAQAFKVNTITAFKRCVYENTSMRDCLNAIYEDVTIVESTEQDSNVYTLNFNGNNIPYVKAESYIIAKVTVTTLEDRKILYIKVFDDKGVYSTLSDYYISI